MGQAPGGRSEPLPPDRPGSTAPAPSGPRERIRAAAKVSDEITDAWHDAQQALHTLWVNGAGVISDVSMARGDLGRAKTAIDKAYATINNYKHWPRDEDYDA